MTTSTQRLTLSREQRARLANGDYRPLVFDTKPDCEPGTVFVFAWSRPKRHCDPETGKVFEAPAAPAAWIKATKLVRQTRNWVVHFDVFDKRHLSLMVARGSGYTTDPSIAIDRAEAVLTEKDMERYAADARAARAAQLERDSEARRRQERAIRGRLREALRGLSPDGQVALLVEVERLIRAATELEDAA